MVPGYAGNLLILASDHRGSFREDLLGVSGEPTARESARLVEANGPVWEGFEVALASGGPAEGAGVLFAEETGAAAAREADETAVLLSKPVEKSGRDVLEHGDDGGAHSEAFDPGLAAVPVRRSPDGEPMARLTRSPQRGETGGAGERRRRGDARSLAAHGRRCGRHAGFAVGRTAGCDGVAGCRSGIPEREQVAANMAATSMRFIEIYE